MDGYVFLAVVGTGFVGVYLCLFAPIRRAARQEDARRRAALAREMERYQ